jgi:enterochelin esterase-like enzyme
MTCATFGGRTRTVRLYLPPSYARPESAGRRFGVVYMLHGWPGSDGNWVNMGHACQTADSMIARGEIPDVILVFPNGGGTGLLGRSMWLDSYDGHARLETYVAHELVTWVDSLYRTVRDARHRAIVGLSDGGTGGFDIAFRHPDIFGAVASHSGTFTLRRSLGDGGVVGPEPGATAFLEHNSPALEVERLAPRLKDMTLYLDCGTADESLEDNRDFDRRLTRLGLAHVYREFPGSHDWRYWSEHLHQSLATVTASMR